MSAFLILFILNCSKSEKNELQGAVITHISGNVSISTIDDSKKFITLSSDRLYTKEGIILPGQILKTGKDSRVDLQFRDGMVFRVGPDTQILLQESQILSGENYSKVLLELKKGKVYTKVGKMEKTSSYQIKAPTSIASVRGTDFLVKADEKNSEVLVEDGSVEVSTDTGESEVVSSGEKAETANDKIEVSELTDEDKKELNDMGSNIQSISESARSQMQDIIANFEENKKLMEKALKDQKEKDREMMDEQKAKDREMIEEQKAKDRKNIDEQTGKGRENIGNITDESKKGMQEQTEKGKESLETTKKSADTDTIKKSGNTDAIKNARGGLDQIKNQKTEIK